MGRPTKNIDGKVYRTLSFGVGKEMYLAIESEATDRGVTLSVIAREMIERGMPRGTGAVKKFVEEHRRA